MVGADRDGNVLDDKGHIIKKGMPAELSPAETGEGKLIIEYRPPKRVVLHSVQKVNIESLLNTSTMGVEPGGIGRPLYFIGDVVFFLAEVPITEPMVKRYLSGILDIAHFVWAKDQGFVAQHGSYYEHSVSKVKVPMLRHDHNEVFVAVVDFVQQMEEGKKA